MAPIRTFLVLVGFFLYASVTYGEEILEGVACEHKELALKCPRGKEIHVVNATYGRHLIDHEQCACSAHCISRYQKYTSCSSLTSTQLVMKSCQGRRRCYVQASISIFGDPCPGVWKYLEVKYECLDADEVERQYLKGTLVSNDEGSGDGGDTGSGQDTSGVKKYRLVECERFNGKPQISDMHIECAYGQVVHIASANYGRMKADSEICSCKGRCGKAQTVTNCSASGSLEKVKRKCEGKRRCYVPPTNAAFGDPCKGTKKYLEVVYWCGASEITAAPTQTGVIRKVKACAHHTIYLTCDPEQVIKIYNAEYGRKTPSEKVCPSDNSRRKVRYNTKCHAKKSLDIVSTKCAGKSSCALRALNAVFGDPCKGTVKYLEVAYKCVRPADDLKDMIQNVEEENELQTKVVCEWKSGKISCDEGLQLEILNASYGRSKPKYSVCFKRPHLDTTKCSSDNAKEIVFDECSGQQECQLVASKATFGSACKGTSKYLEVRYACVNENEAGDLIEEDVGEEDNGDVETDVESTLLEADGSDLEESAADGTVEEIGSDFFVY